MKILVVEDSARLRRSLGEGLARVGHEVDHAADGLAGLELATRGRYDLILLDLMLPGLDGMAVLDRMRARQTDTPVLILSARDRVDDRIRGLREGADDYLVKPFSFDELIVRIEAIDRRRSGSLVDETGAGNAEAFARRIDMAIEETRLQPGAHYAVVLVELDQTGSIANGWGPASRRELLAAIIERMIGENPADTMIARVGTDTIGVVADGLRHLSEVYALTSTLRDTVARTVHLGDDEVYLSASIGVVWARSEYGESEQVLRDAGAAVQSARRLGRNRCIMFQNAMRDRIVRELLAENDLRRAIREREFFLEYQPIFRTGTEEILEVEALLRWNHPTRGLVPPGEFLPSLEQTGLIVQVGNRVLFEACEQLAEWRKAGMMGSTRIAVNLAAMQLVPGIVDVVRNALARSGLGGRDLCLEVTESMVIEASDAVFGIFETLRAMGVRIALDDFGTGYSSLKYLQELPFDTLKIDRSFVVSQGSNGPNAILRSIVSLAHELDLEIVAEGVERDEQLQMLRELDCDRVQGFLLSRPAGPFEIAERCGTVNQKLS